MNVRRGRPRGCCAIAPVLLVVMVGALVSACADSGGAPADEGGRGRAGFPVTVTECGNTTTFSAPPRRVVILNPAIADILVDLNVGDRIIAQSGTTGLGEPLPQNKAVMAKVPVLSPHAMTSTAALLGVAPDLVISDEAAWLDPELGGASPKQLQQAGIRTYTSVSGCGDGRNGRVTDLFTDIDNYGAIFGVRDKATQLATDLRVRLDAIESRIGDKPKIPVFEFFEQGGQFFNTSVGIANDALDKSGGVSIVSDATSMEPISKEAITARNPQAFVELESPTTVIDHGKEAAALIQAFPTTDAAKARRVYFIPVAEAASPGTPRIIDGIAALATWLHPDAFTSR